MRETRHYCVAGHRFSVEGNDRHFVPMQNYEPFRTAAGPTLFSLTIETAPGGPTLCPAPDAAPQYTEEMRQQDDGQVIICGHSPAGEPVFGFQWHTDTAGWLITTADYLQGRLITTGLHPRLAIDNALMIMFALSTADRGTALFHASAVSYNGKGYIFLGPSGTGKSTHAGLWVRHIEGAGLLNDDNPVIRIGQDGTAQVYGSPWSGKTPCYRNVSCPLGAITVLSQAPRNSISQLSGIQAYAALMTSISGKRWDSRIADGLHITEEALAAGIPVWHLECLPDREAALLCRNTIATDDRPGPQYSPEPQHKP